MRSETTTAEHQLSYRQGQTPAQQLRREKADVRPSPEERQPPPEVLDYFPSVIPIMSAELNVIETYLGSAVDELLNSVAAEPFANRGED